MNADTPTDAKQLGHQVKTLTARNAKLADLLKSSRDKLQDLSAQIEALGEPASTYGIYLSHHLREAEVFTSGRLMRVKIAPDVSPNELKPGILVRLGDGAIIVEACGYDDTGSLATLSEKIGEERAIVADNTGQETVVYLTTPLREKARAGDTLLVDTRVGYAFEVIDKTEVNQLSLDEVPDVTYADIGGLDAQIDQIRDSIELPFAHPDLYRDYDLRPPKGVLLYGPPGCGKTLIAKAIANQLGEGQSYFLNVKGPEILNKFVGETERRIRLIFERAREMAASGHPVIVFFDEMESLFRTRGSGVSSDIETTVVPQLLTELDGVEGLDNVIVIGATNREELIDPAILRPGRLDIKVRVNRPDRAGARDIFTRYLTDEIPLTAPADSLIESALEALYEPRPFLELTLVDGQTRLLHYSDFISGAMISNIVDRAKKFAIKEHIRGEGRGVAAEHLQAAVREEQSESEDLPNTAEPDAWAKISGLKTGQINSVRPIG